LAIVHQPYTFQRGAPPLETLHRRAEQLGGLALTSDYTPGGRALEFDCFPGKVDVLRKSNEICLRSDLVDAPVLLELLGMTLVDLGGKIRDGWSVEFALQLPLSEAFVIEKTQRHRQDIKKAARPVWLVVLGVFAVAVLVVSLIVWVLWRWLSAG